MQGAVLAESLAAAREAFAVWHWACCGAGAHGGGAQEADGSDWEGESPDVRRAAFLALLQSVQAESDSFSD